MMNIIKKIIYNKIPLFNLHPEAINLIKSGFKLTNPTSSDFPSENLPLASRVIASGMWNYCFFQFYRNFVGPYWVERQYNPLDPSFIPRATSMLSLNLTHRNWFGFRGPTSSLFSMIDPAGAFSPVVGFYSIELAFRYKNQFFTPNRREININIDYEDNLPIPVITYQKKDLKIQWKLLGDTKTNTTILSIIEYNVENHDWELIIGIRPFNAEGGALINHLAYEENEYYANININSETEIILLNKPNKVFLSTLEKGDAYFINTNLKEVECPHGVATGSLIYSLYPNIEKNNQILFYARTYEQLASSQLDLFDNYFNPNTEKRKSKAEDVETRKKIKTNYILRELKPITQLYLDRNEFLEEVQLSNIKWKEQIQKKSKFITGKTLWNKMADLHSNIVFELQTEKKITPGIYTYRQFWFRDAAYMLSALSSWNFLKETRNVLETYPERQEKDGFFKSHEGEWDSTGQAIWTIVDYYKKTKDIELLKETIYAIIKGANWIIRKRHKGYKKVLMPAGFSAEHLGPSDYYFWDNLWSIAGLRDAAFACSVVPNFQEHHRYFLKQMNEYIVDFNHITRLEREKYGILTAAPNRGIDPGIIGSVVDLYPLQLNILSNLEITKTLKSIYKLYFIDNLFFHSIIHSGFNIYLSLQVAQGFLKLNYPKITRKILKSVLKKRGGLLVYPEAIHPTTGGGVMGDGFHGWASAELILLFRELVLSEYRNRLHIFKGLRKKELFNNNFFFGPFPLQGANITITGYLENNGGKIEFQIERVEQINYRDIIIYLPYKDLTKYKIQIIPEIPFKIIKNQLILSTFTEHVMINIYL